MRYLVIVLLLGFVGCLGVKDLGITEDSVTGTCNRVCALKWYGPIILDSYEELYESITYSLKGDTCTAEYLLCILLIHDFNGTAGLALVRFKDIDDIPKTSIKDVQGNYIIQYLNEDL